MSHRAMLPKGQAMNIDPKAKEFLLNFLDDYEGSHVRIGQITIGSG